MSWLNDFLSPDPRKNPLLGNPVAQWNNIKEAAGSLKGGSGSGTAKVEPTEPSFADYLQQGYDAETDTLAKRRLIDAAAQLGGVYYDGQILSQQQYNDKIAFEQNKIKEAQASGNAHALQEAQTELTKLQAGSQYNFAGAGSADLAQQQLLQEIQGADQTTRAMLDLEAKYGPEAAALARKNLAAVDPTGFALREQTGANLLSGGNSLESMYGGMTAPQYESFNDSRLPQYQRLNQSDAPQLKQLSESYLPQLNNVNGIKLQDTGAARAGRGLLETQIFDELAQAGQPDAALTRGAEQAARARGASTGNILGDSSALQESLQVQLAQRGLDTQRRNEAMGLLTSGQTTSDKDNELSQLQLQNDLASTGFNNEMAQQMFGNRAALTADNNNTAQQGFANQAAIVGQNNSVSDQAFNSAMSAINQRNQTAQNSFAAQNQLTQQRAGARQQDMANTQSFLGLQPVSAQAGGYDNVSAPFNPGNVQPGTLSNPNAGQLGAEFYSQLYGMNQQAGAVDKSADAAKKAGMISAGAGIAGAAIIAI